MVLKKSIRVLLLGSALCTFVSFSGAGYAQEISMTPMKSEDLPKSDVPEVPGSKLAVSLKEAVAVGISTNPEYGVVAASRRATDEELKQGKALFLPSVDVRADAGFEYSDDSGTRAGLDSDDTESLYRYEAGVTLTQMLFDGWESHYEVERQKARVNSSAHRVRETAELVGLSIVESYIEVLRQRELLTIARQNVADHLSILELVTQGTEAGRSTQADMEQIKARVAQARATETDTRQALRNAESRYRQEVGDIPGQLSVPQTPFEKLAADVDNEVLLSLAHSPTLDIFASDIEVAYAESLGTRSTFYPQVDLQLNGRQGHDLGGVEGRDRSASALAVMNWNLYRGGADTARAREFIHRHQQSKESRAEAGRALENDVRQTWAAMVAAGERAEQFGAQAAANTEVVKSYKDQFSLDRRTLLDVLDSQNELFVSRSNTVNAEFLEMLAVYRLLALKGQLLPSMELNYPRESAISNNETWSDQDRMDAR